MSNLGQGLAAVGGAFIGFMIGGPTGALYGFQAGMLAGSVLFPTKLPTAYGPRLTDARTTTASVGDPIPKVYGVGVVGGTVIYLGELVETEVTSSVGRGKNKQTVVTYQYNQTLALGLCEGEIAGVRRIRENGKVVYDISAQADGESDADYSARVAQSQTYAENFTLYLGSTTQTVDPTLETELGTGNVSAYRDLAYIVYSNRLMREDQGYRHPQFEFEIIASGSMSCTTTTEYSNDWMPDWPSNSESLSDCRDPDFYPRYVYSALQYSGNTYTGSYDTLEEARGAISTQTGAPVLSTLWGWSTTPGYAAGNGIYPTRPMSPDDTGGYNIPDNVWDKNRYFHYSIRSGSAIDDTVYYINPNATSFDAWVVANNMVGKYWTGRQINIGAGNLEYTAAHGVIYLLGVGVPGNDYRVENNYSVRVTRVPQEPPDVSELYPPAPIDGYYIDDDGNYVRQTPWVSVSGTFRVLSKTNNSGSDTQYERLPLNPCLPSTDPNYAVEAWWTPYKDAAVTAGTLPDPPGTFGAPANWGEIVSSAWTRDYTVCTLDPDRVSLADIIEDICAECGLTDIDVSDLETTYVTGFVRGNVMTGRSVIESLRPVGQFDCVESSFTLKFPTRGKASVRTLATSDLAAHMEGEKIPSGITTRKLQDPELPKALRVTYSAESREYERGEQRSPTRYNTTAVNEPELTLPVTIGDDQAAQIAEITWSEAWTGRWIYTFALDTQHLDLEVGDAITVPVDGRNTRMRITAIDDRIFGVRQIEAVRDAIADYTSTATGSVPAPGATPDDTIATYGTLALELLDLPYLGEDVDPRDKYGTADMLALVKQEDGNTWPGAAIYRSNDIGSIGELLTLVPYSPTWGALVSTPTSGPTEVFDHATTITVDLAGADMTLESITEAEALAGGNICAMGANERWEVFQFVDAVQIDTDPNRWELTVLLRGRRGTEWAVGEALAGDTFVLLTPKGVLPVVPTPTRLNVLRWYRAVYVSDASETGSAVGLTPRGVVSKPWSPVNVEVTGTYAGGEWTITWNRRDRVAEELPDEAAFGLNEAPEYYEIDIYANGVIDSTYQSTSESVTINAGLITGSAPYTARVQQISSVVGRGYYTEVDLP